MLTRVFDDVKLMQVIRDPSVWPHVTLGHDIDISLIASDPANVMLVNDHGGFGFIKIDEGLYEQHTAFLPAGRGKAALEAGKEALEYLYTRTDCIAIRSFVVIENKAARGYARKLGFLEIDDCEIKGHPAKALLMTVKDWAKSLCRG